MRRRRRAALLLGHDATPPFAPHERGAGGSAAERWHCSSYRFGDILVRGGGKTALFSAAVEIKASMDGRDWSGTFWITDLWRRGRVRRGWKLVQRTISRPDDNPDLPKAIRSLQLWK